MWKTNITVKVLAIIALLSIVIWTFSSALILIFSPWNKTSNNYDTTNYQELLKNIENQNSSWSNNMQDSINSTWILNNSSKPNDIQNIDSSWSINSTWNINYNSF